jgi:hypothetical protein
MASVFASTIRTALRRVSAPNHDAVHFHIDSDGRAFVCDFHRCDSPSLTVGEASAADARRR